MLGPFNEQPIPEGPDTPTESVPADWVPPDPDTDDGTATEPEAEGE